MTVPCSFMEFIFSSAEEGITMNKGCTTKPDKSQQSTAHVFDTEGGTSLIVHLGVFKSGCLYGISILMQLQRGLG